MKCVARWSGVLACGGVLLLTLGVVLVPQHRLLAEEGGPPVLLICPIVCPTLDCTGRRDSCYPSATGCNQHLEFCSTCACVSASGDYEPPCGCHGRSP
jgi:hypothetical protein